VAGPRRKDRRWATSRSPKRARSGSRGEQFVTPEILPAGEAMPRRTVRYQTMALRMEFATLRSVSAWSIGAVIRNTSSRLSGPSVVLRQKVTKTSP
jgi:hypothetical protein